MNRTLIFIVALVLIATYSTLSVYAQSPDTPPTSSEEATLTEEPTPTPLDVQPAETGIDFTISPVFINLATDPGQPVSSEIKIRNNSNVDEYLGIQISRFEASADGSQPSLIDIDPNDPFLSWIEFSEREFKLSPNETKTISFTISPSSDAALGYYYGLIFQRLAEGSSFAENQAVISGAPAVSVLLEVKSPNTLRELNLVDFTTDKLFYEYLPTTFNVTLENTGNIHIVPAGDVFIDSTSQDNIASLRINEGFGNVLPQSTRTFTIQWDNALITRKNSDDNGVAYTDKNGNPVLKTTVDFDKPLSTFRIGKYTAHALVIYDNGERDVPLEASVSFWVIPYKLIGGIILAVIGPVVLYHIVVRRRRKKKD